MGYREDMGSAVPLPLGLTAWMKEQGPAVWHAFARSVRFGAPMATIDLLMTADWISRQPDCDPATGQLLLARAVEAGLMVKAPAAMDDATARAFCLNLRNRLAASSTRAAIGLTQSEARLVTQHCADLVTSTPIRHSPAPKSAYDFAGNRPVVPAEAMHKAA